MNTPVPVIADNIAVRSELRPALLLAGLFALVTFGLHLVSSIYGSHLGYGFFRDELYFLVCGHHLDWGYVDQPPLVALQARIAEMVFGLTPTGIRILSFAAGGVKVGLTGLFGYIGASVCSVVTGQLADRFGWDAVIWVYVAAAVVGALVLATTWKKRSPLLQ